MALCKTEYEITPLGKKMLDNEIVRLTELLSNGRRIMGGDKDEKIDL